jgi:hypothetical protein
MTVSSIQRWMLHGIVLGLVLFVVTACGGGGQQTQQPASQPEQPTQPPAAEQPAPPPAQSEEEQLDRARAVSCELYRLHGMSQRRWDGPRRPHVEGALWTRSRSHSPRRHGDESRRR